MLSRRAHHCSRSLIRSSLLLFISKPFSSPVSSFSPTFWSGRVSSFNDIVQQRSSNKLPQLSPKIICAFGEHRVPLQIPQGTLTPLSLLNANKDISKQISSYHHSRDMLWNSPTKEEEKSLEQPTQTSASPIIIALVNGKITDLNQPLSVSDSEIMIEYLPFSDTRASAVFWHSSAHILGAATELHFNQKYNGNVDVFLCDGPPLKEGGFFYDVLIQDKTSKAVITVAREDVESIEKIAQQFVKKSEFTSFQKIQVTREEALALFDYSPIKKDLIMSIPETEPLTVYRCGDFIDLCSGPHVPSLSLISYFQVTQTAADTHKLRVLPAFSNLPNPFPVQRIFGISFPNKEEKKKWEAKRKEAERRDHRLIGNNLSLFFFHPLSPGAPFFLPHGTRSINSLLSYLRQHYRSRGYDEVRTPIVFDKSLWEKSGHWDHYKEHMYIVREGKDVDEHGNILAPSSPPTPSPSSSSSTSPITESITASHSEHNCPSCQSLKPMNCPSHCLIFAHKKRTYRELPLRFADFSPLHRNEDKGALSGLTRVRLFHQDDAHIFCTRDQIEQEVRNVLGFLKEVYDCIHLPFRMKLSTRPEKYMGSLELWNAAESSLKSLLQEVTKGHFEIDEGDGAFYGPKIDVLVRDALGREHQCATVQLDFQLPLRFDLKYTGPDGAEHTPVMIHRAILGSMERFFSILCEHTGGRFPLWISPRQVSIVTVSNQEHLTQYANKIADQLWSAGFYVDVSRSDASLNKQIREAQVLQYNYIVVLGAEEETEQVINVRTREGTKLGKMQLEEFLTRLQQEIKEKK